MSDPRQSGERAGGAHGETASSSRHVRVLLVDDQPLVRAGLRWVLAETEGFSVVAECGDGAEAVAAVRARPLEVDVVLMDVRMRGVDGIEATRLLRELGGPPVLILTTFDEDEVLWGAIEAGAAGFVLKDAPAEDLMAATRAVAAGGAWLDPAVTPRVLEVTRQSAVPRHRAAARRGEIDSTGARRAQADGDRRVERGDRRRAGGQRGHGQDPRRAASSPSSASGIARARSCTPTSTASPPPDSEVSPPTGGSPGPARSPMWTPGRAA